MKETKPERGEITTIIRPGYRIDYIRPCGEGRKVAEGKVTFKVRIDELLPLLEKKFQKVNHFPKLDMVRFELDGANVLLYQNGDLKIRKVKDVDEAVRAAEKIVSVLKGE